MTAFTYTENLTVVHCTCGVAFAIPGALYRQAQDHGRTVHCPLGHSFHYTETSDVKLARLQKEAEQMRKAHQATRDLLHAEERSHAATRGHLTRSRKRAAAAVCPCCHRSFVQLRRHLAAKHPDYQP